MNKIRNYIKSKIGSRIIVISLQNRNKEEKYEGIIANTYSNIFTIIDNMGKYKSFSYADILAGYIRVYI